MSMIQNVANLCKFPFRLILFAGVFLQRQKAMLPMLRSERKYCL